MDLLLTASLWALVSTVFFQFVPTASLQVLHGKAEDPFILLPCHFDMLDPDRVTVLWTRSDISPSTVHEYNQEGHKSQNQLYKCRTFMKTDALETGDLSLNLTHLQSSDTGTYTCVIRTDREELRVADIELQVKVQVQTWLVLVGAILGLLPVVTCGGCCFTIVYYKRRLALSNRQAQNGAVRDYHKNCSPEDQTSQSLNPAKTRSK